jgi:hypothetical protein
MCSCVGSASISSIVFWYLLTYSTENPQSQSQGGMKTNRQVICYHMPSHVTPILQLKSTLLKVMHMAVHTLPRCYASHLWHGSHHAHIPSPSSRMSHLFRLCECSIVKLPSSRHIHSPLMWRGFSTCPASLSSSALRYVHTFECQCLPNNFKMMTGASGTYSYLMRWMDIPKHIRFSWCHCTLDSWWKDDTCYPGFCSASFLYSLWVCQLIPKQHQWNPPPILDQD